MKIIFLDIDGVLNVIPDGRDEYGNIFHKHLINNLKTIIDETGAKIVITSSWRTEGLEWLRKMWKWRNIPGEIIDITPNCYDLVKCGKFQYYDLVTRGDEIQYWLDNHDNVSNYVIIDDDDDMLDNQMSKLVLTTGNTRHIDCVDLGYGLTKECAKKAIEILNK